MKKRLPLILSILGMVIIFAAAAVVYKMYFEPKAVKVTAKPLPAPVHRPLLQLPKAPEPAKPARSGVETKKPEMSAAGAPPKVVENTIASIAYDYNAKGRRDPFATLIVKVEPERKKGAIPLENYDVSEFRLKAVFWNESGFYALVSSPEGKNYTIRESTTIGLHGGKVDKIMKDSVIIKEFLKDYKGSVKPNYTVLKLHREEEG